MKCYRKVTGHHTTWGKVVPTFSIEFRSQVEFFQPKCIERFLSMIFLVCHFQDGPMNLLSSRWPSKFLPPFRFLEFESFTLAQIFKEQAFYLPLFFLQDQSKPYPWPLFSSYPVPPEYLPHDPSILMTAFEQQAEIGQFLADSASNDFSNSEQARIWLGNCREVYMRSLRKDSNAVCMFIFHGSDVNPANDFSSRS